MQIPTPSSFERSNAAGGEEFLGCLADVVEALFGVLEREVCAAVCGDEVVLQVGDYHYHLVAADLDAGEVDRRIGQSEDIRAPSAARFDFAPVVDDLLAHELFDELGDRRNADVQFPGQFG